jgi:hypothetical protein
MSKKETTEVSKQRIERLFLTSRPRIATFPHTLVKSGRNTLAIIAASLDVVIGLWGERPLLRADGSNYLEPETGRIEHDFALWKLSTNQAYLFERANVSPDPSFRMFISANSSVETLSRTYEHFDHDQGAAWFGDYINYVCDWLRYLRWALVPLEGEEGWSIFVGDSSERPSMLAAKRGFESKAIPVAHLEFHGNEALWVND